jgi:polysaccharide deacetylase 2 family uncharacterized protein YibQ
MARGFLGGVIMGGVVCVSTVGAVSVLTPLPVPPQVGDVVVGVASPERITQAGSGETARDSDALIATAPASPQAPAPDPDTLVALDAETLSTAAQPETGGADSLAAPAGVTQSGGEALEGDEPVLPNPLALAPMAPGVADELSISTEPAQPQQPQPEAIANAFDDPAQPQMAVDEEVVLPNAADAVEDVTVERETTPENPAPQIAEAEPIPDTETVPEADTVPEDEMADGQSQSPDPELQVASASGAVIEPRVDTASATTETGPTMPAFPDQAPEQTEPAETESAETQPAQTVPTVVIPPETDKVETVQTAVLATAPRIGTPSVNLLDRDGGVSVRRPAGATAVTVVDDLPAPSAATDPNLRPIERFAQAFQPDADKPMMSIVLIDDGTSATNGAVGIAALRSFPYPLSFAIDSALPDAAERTERLRKEGFEVLALVDLPEGAQATDVETTFAATFAQLPEIIGVLEGSSISQQSSRDVSDQVTAYLSQSGHGWVTQAKGLNTAATLARKEGVPAKPIFRDFDSKGQNAVVIRRFLDQAAFKAGQEGGVIMLGRLRPETISALLLWGLQDRAGQVALVPVSAVLLDED